MAALTIFTQPKVDLPAHIAAAQTDGVGNIDPRNTVPQLSFRGRTFRTVINGEETILEKPDGDPVTSVHVVIVGFNKNRSRAYYEGEYQTGKATPPTCWSTDGETPDESVREKQAKFCAKCPHSVKGSKITANGKETTECAVFRRIAVVPTLDLDVPPMMMKLPQTTLWDKNMEDYEAKGFYAFDQYTEMLRKKGCNHTGFVSTQIKCDARVEYPKLIFAAKRWLEPEEFAKVKELFNSQQVEDLLKAPENIAAARKQPATPEDDEGDKSAVKAKPARADDDDADDTPPPKKSKAAVADDDDDADDVPAPKKSKAAVADDDDDADDVPAPKKSKAAVADDDDDTPPPPKKHKPVAVTDDDDDDEPAPKKKAKAAVADDDDDDEPAPKKKAKAVGSLLDEWNN